MVPRLRTLRLYQGQRRTEDHEGGICQNDRSSSRAVVVRIYLTTEYNTETENIREGQIMRRKRGSLSTNRKVQ